MLPSRVPGISGLIVAIISVSIPRCIEHFGVSSSTTYLSSSTSECTIVETINSEYSDHYPLIYQSDDWTDSVRLNFSVKTMDHVAVLLSDIPDPPAYRPSYEIVLGMKLGIKFGTKYDISYIKNKTDGLYFTTKNKLLSSTEMRDFWITVNKNGSVLVGRNKTVKMSLPNSDPIHVRYFSFESVNAIWKFNCPQNETFESEVKKMKPKLTPKERLQSDVIVNMDSVMAPIYEDDDSMTADISAGFDIFRIALDTDNSELFMTGIATVEWIDHRLLWEPANYDDIDEINVKGYQAWIPNIVLVNPVEHKTDSKPFISYGDMLVTYLGAVSWTMDVNLRSACDLDFQNWPWDTHICNIQLAIWSQNVSLKSVWMRRQNLVSEWQVLSDTEHTVDSESVWTITNHYSRFINASYSDDTNRHYDRIQQIQFVIKRKTSFYHNLFFHLFVVVSSLLLVAVCPLPLSTRKMTLNCFCIFLLSVLLILTANSLPDVTEQTPTIVMAYSIMLVTADIYAAICAFSMALIRTKSSPPQFVVAILDNKLLAIVCFLKKDNELYYADNKNYREKTDVKIKRSITKSEENISSNWSKLSVIIDNAFSLCILVLTIFLFNSF